MFILAHHTDWYRFYVFSGYFLFLFSAQFFQKWRTFLFYFLCCFKKYSAVQFLIVFRFLFTSTRISKINRAIVLTKEFGALLRVCKCYIVELIESYVLCFAVQRLKFTLPCMQLECNFHANVCLILFVINPCFSISAARNHCFNTNNHKIKTFFAWKNKHFYNKGKIRGGTLSFDKSTDAKL